MEGDYNKYINFLKIKFFVQVLTQQLHNDQVLQTKWKLSHGAVRNPVRNERAEFQRSR
jgi:hypothetical protein